MIKKFNLLFLTLFNIGKIKFAPGTIASFSTCVLFLFLLNIFDISLILFITIIVFFYSLFALNNNYDDFNTEDPQEIVVDEFVGQMLPLICIPIYETLYLIHNLYYCIAAFIIFRIFDIWKPFPVNYIDDNIEGALGIMLDDIIPGIYTVIVLFILFFFLGG